MTVQLAKSFKPESESLCTSAKPGLSSLRMCINLFLFSVTPSLSSLVACLHAGNAKVLAA